MQQTVSSLSQQSRAPSSSSRNQRLPQSRGPYDPEKRASQQSPLAERRPSLKDRLRRCKYSADMLGKAGPSTSLPPLCQPALCLGHPSLLGYPRQAAEVLLGRSYRFFPSQAPSLAGDESSDQLNSLLA